MTEPRTTAERRAHAESVLQAEQQLWFATSSDKHGVHMIPVSFVWDGAAITLTTFAQGRTAANLRADPRARLALGTTADVVLVDGSARFVPVDQIASSTVDALARVTHDPRVMPGLTCLQVDPRRILVWNGFHEFEGRTVMADGRWLDDAGASDG